MLFNSPIFVFLFLPISVALYFALNRLRMVGASMAVLAVGSLFFYGWWNPAYLPLIVVSILINYGLGRWLARRPDRVVLAGGIALNLAVLGYYKYAGFFIENLNRLCPVLTRGMFGAILVAAAVGGVALLVRVWRSAGRPVSGMEMGVCLAPLAMLAALGAWFMAAGRTGESLWLDRPELLLPLAISFFTFQQVAYLVDSYRGQTGEYDLARYTLFVTFFPQLIAGPIVHHREMMPQFARSRNWLPDWRNIHVGLFFFAVGLCKKCVLADTLSQWADAGYARPGDLGLTEAWTATLAYTFQLYFDFSGYCDMAMGAARFFNVRLPVNFDSPYRAVDIQDFWRRWHITLSRWLRDYIYIPLGGNRGGDMLTVRNVVLTFLLGGIWHGAGWGFVLWGALHGCASGVHRLWSAAGRRLPPLAGWALTFAFVHCAWVPFRAPDLASAGAMFRSMAGRHGITTGVLPNDGWQMVLVAGVIAFLLPNANAVVTGWHEGQGLLYRPWAAVGIGLLLAIGLTAMLMVSESPFLYFNF